MPPGFWGWTARLLPLEWLLLPPAAHGPAGSCHRPGEQRHREQRYGEQRYGEHLQGEQPLAWWAAGLYEGALRRELLSLRRHLRPQQLRPLVRVLASGLQADPRLRSQRGTPLLVPIPSWKSRPNPLPPLLARQLCEQLGWPITPLLVRSRPVLGQHRLNRELRWANQQNAFRCDRTARQDPRGRRPVVLLDDILTTGATACSAAASLEAAGWRLTGLACLARTPERRGP